MTTIALMYHDVTPAGREDTSGFPGGDASRYKLTPRQFDAHLAAIRLARGTAPASPPRLTFDDGGASAMAIADHLERAGWIGQFFMTAGYIGRPGFLGPVELRDLRRRGHVVGSHSYSHPLRMGRLEAARISDEWTRSIALLGDILGEPIVTASVPGGYYSEVVGRTAAAAGVTSLFTSEPTFRTRQIDGMTVIGRYVVRRSTEARVVAAVVAGSSAPRLKQLALWELKKAVKTVAGGTYLAIRDRLLGRSDAVQWGDEPRWSKHPS